MIPRMRTVGIVCCVIAVILVIAHAQSLFISDKERTKNMLHEQGLSPVAISIRDTNSTFTATVNSDPNCTVSGMTDATDDSWMLNRFNYDWYPRSEYSYSDPGMPKWPPHEVTVARVALEHPEVCDTN